MDKTALVARINSFPRVRLGQFPTPMELMPRLTQTLGRRSPSGGGPTLWAKRDDFVGPAMGGNKTRKWGFLFGAALDRRAQIAATFGGGQITLERVHDTPVEEIAKAKPCFEYIPRPARLE